MSAIVISDIRAVRGNLACVQYQKLDCCVCGRVFGGQTWNLTIDSANIPSKRHKEILNYLIKDTIYIVCGKTTSTCVELFELNPLAYTGK